MGSRSLARSSICSSSGMVITSYDDTKCFRGSGLRNTLRRYSSVANLDPRGKSQASTGRVSRIVHFECLVLAGAHCKPTTLYIDRVSFQAPTLTHCSQYCDKRALTKTYSTVPLKRLILTIFLTQYYVQAYFSRRFSALTASSLLSRRKSSRCGCFVVEFRPEKWRLRRRVANPSLPTNI